MTWSETCPTEPGWYWMRGRDGTAIVRVSANESGVYFESPGTGSMVQIGDPSKTKWAGPIPIPTEDR